MNATAHTKATRIAGIGIFAAIVVVLQLFATLVPFTFPITLVLVPIVIGAAIYGIAAGAILGGVFALVVLVMTISGADPGAFILWTANPLATFLVIMLRGILAGTTAGAVYQALAPKHKMAAVVCAAIATPIVNTGLFILAMQFIFPDIVTQWADGASHIYFLLIGLAGLNFVIEMAINIVLSPTIVRIIHIAKRGR